MTNAQAALLAASTIYQGTAGNVSVPTVLGMAGHMKRGLDRLDAADKEAKAAAKDAMLDKHLAGNRVVGFTPGVGVGPVPPKPGPREPVFTDELPLWHPDHPQHEHEDCCK